MPLARVLRRAGERREDGEGLYYEAGMLCKGLVTIFPADG